MGASAPICFYNTYILTLVVDNFSSLMSNYVGYIYAATILCFKQCRRLHILQMFIKR